MKIVIAVAALMLIASSAFAAIDFPCVQRCQNQGSMYAYCVSHCSF